MVATPVSRAAVEAGCAWRPRAVVVITVIISLVGGGGHADPTEDGDHANPTHSGWASGNSWANPAQGGWGAWGGGQPSEEVPFTVADMPEQWAPPDTTHYQEQAHGDAHVSGQLGGHAEGWVTAEHMWSSLEEMRGGPEVGMEPPPGSGRKCDSDAGGWDQPGEGVAPRSSCARHAKLHTGASGASTALGIHHEEHGGRVGRRQSGRRRHRV